MDAKAIAVSPNTCGSGTAKVVSSKVKAGLALSVPDQASWLALCDMRAGPALWSPVQIQLLPVPDGADGLSREMATQ